MECCVLPNEKLDRSLLGFLGMQKLGIVLDAKRRKISFV